MGNKSSLLLREEEIAQIQEATGFTPNQIERLYSRFTSLDRGDCGTLSREDFLRIPELAINPLGERIVNAFFEESGNDRVNFLQFMQVLALFRPIKKNSTNRLNSRQEKLRCELRRKFSESPVISLFICFYLQLLLRCTIWITMI
uniref:Chp_2 protein n=1 Tax=Fopius arisanus TaxID=64838 RepID=A0A0C9Q5Q4_9HYME